MARVRMTRIDPVMAQNELGAHGPGPDDPDRILYWHRMNLVPMAKVRMTRIGFRID